MSSVAPISRPDPYTWTPHPEATLGIVGFVSALAMSPLLIQFGDQARPVAALLPLFVVTPLLFLGAAQLYFDQFARLPENAPRAGLTAPQRRGQPSTRG